MVQLLMAATLVISRLASPVSPLPSSHLADSRMHLETSERRRLAIRDARPGRRRPKIWKIKKKKTTPNHTIYK